MSIRKIQSAQADNMMVAANITSKFLNFIITQYLSI
jgi:hypothetical protein